MASGTSDPPRAPRHRAALALLALVLSPAGLAACGSDDEAGTEEAAPVGDFFGVNGDVLFVRVLDGQAPSIEPALQSIEDSSLSFVRSSIDWRRLQPVDPAAAGSEPDFELHDAWVGALASHGLRWEPAILGWPVPPWAGDPELVDECGSRAPPADAASYAGLVELLVERYGRDGSFWDEHPELPYVPATSFEIWNEPNHFAFWCPKPDPERFAELTVSASLAIHAADPDAEVMLGGLAGFGESDPKGQTLTPLDFLAAAVEFEPSLASVVDSVGLHPYAPDPDVVAKVIEEFRANSAALGFESTPIDINEVGWPTRGESGFTVVSDEEVRADYMEQLAEDTYGASDALGVESLAPYSWITREENPADAEDWFGLADPVTGEPKAAGLAYGTVAERLSSSP